MRFAQKIKMNKIIIAAAGSGKTTYIVNEAIRNKEKHILITTYTDANTEEIKRKFFNECGYIPKNVSIQPWFTFLLNHCVRPYQGKLHQFWIPNIYLVNGQSAQFIAEKNVSHHYFDKDGRIYSDKIAKFACRCNEKSKGMMIYRLSKIYDAVYLDETQDLSGWDLELLYLLFLSDLEILCVGDPRQSTLRTNNSSKNKKKSQVNLLTHFKSIAKQYSLVIDAHTLDTNHRSVKTICDFSNTLYANEDWPQTQSDFNPKDEPHLGIFLIDSHNVDKYLDTYKPIQLRDKITVPVNPNFQVINFRKSKGLTLNRVLIYPTSTMMDWLYKGTTLKDGTKCSFYVAITRARLSVGIVRTPKYSKLVCTLPLWKPE